MSEQICIDQLYLLTLLLLTSLPLIIKLLWLFATQLRAINAYLRYDKFTTKFVWYFNHRKIGITGLFLKFQSSTLGAVSTAVGAALLIPILPGNLQVWAALVISCCWSFIQIIARWLEGVAWGGVDFVFHPPRCWNLTRRAGIPPDAPPPPPLDSPVCAVISNPRFFWEKGIWWAGSYHCAPDSGASKPAKVLRPFRWA